jgi:hypothetical protein
LKTVGDILKTFKPTEDKYISREFQGFGVHLAEKLQDEHRKSLYIKLAKTIPRPVLEQALRFVIDSHARNKGALFMWKLKELGVIGKPKSTPTPKKKPAPPASVADTLF